MASLGDLLHPRLALLFGCIKGVKYLQPGHLSVWVIFGGRGDFFAVSVEWRTTASNPALKLFQ